MWRLLWAALGLIVCAAALLLGAVLIYIGIAVWFA
jgi:hypothetical protein